MTGTQKPQRFDVEDILETIFEGTTTETVVPLHEKILSTLFQRAARPSSYKTRLNTLMEASDKLVARGMDDNDALYMRERLKKIMEHRAQAIARDYFILKTGGQKAGLPRIDEIVSSAHYYLGLLPIRPDFVITPYLRNVMAARHQFGRELQEYMKEKPESFIIHPRRLKVDRVPNIRPPRR